jgi:hypothetical protein
MNEARAGSNSGQLAYAIPSRAARRTLGDGDAYVKDPGEPRRQRSRLSSMFYILSTAAWKIVE